MEKWFEDITPIMDIERNCIITKKGDISIVFRLVLPEVFTLSDDDFEAIHQAFIKAIKILPKHSIFHKQDWYMQSAFQIGEEGIQQGFFEEGIRRHFQGRHYLRHETYIIITKKPEDRKPSSSMFSSLLRPSIVPSEVLSAEALADFESVAGQFQSILICAGLSVIRLTTDELASSGHQMGLVERYYSLADQPGELLTKEVELKPSLRVGHHYCQLYTLGDPDTLPSLCGSRITYDKYSTDRTKFPIAFASSIGLLLPCNHIYNQYLFIEDAQAAVKRLESKRLRLQSLASYSRENAIARDAVNDFINELIADQRLVVKASFNILLWASTTGQLQEAKNLVTTSLARMEASAKLETVGAPQLWWSGIPGNAADFPMNETFETFAEQACCFLAVETNYRGTTPDQGIRFCDRLNAVPVYEDLFDSPRKLGITSNMGMLLCGTSGGGKSMTANHILRTLHHQGAHCVVLDIGGSYRGLCEILKGYYFTYKEDEPIQFNPFPLEGERLDTEKKEFLKELLVALWKQEDERFSRSEYVALSNALEGYYTALQADPTIFPCFNTFYEYLDTVYIEVLRQQRVKDRDFDMDNFLYVLRPYYRGGEFDYLLNATVNLDLLKERFIVVEIDNIKDHPILCPTVMMILMSMVISKMRKLAGTRIALAIDEAWKPITKPGTAEFIKYAYKTFRKFNGVPLVITQELEDLISSPIIKETIIMNSDIKILMDMRKFVNKFDELQRTLGLSEKGKTILLSVNKDNREVFLDLGGKITKVFKNELCPEEYFAFTTEGRERVRLRELADQLGSVELAIAAMIREKKIVA